MGSPPADRVADAGPGNFVDRFAPPSWRPYLRLARLDRPIGWWLLLLPCWWSAALAGVAASRSPDPWHLVLFLVGAVAMRGAGSAWNDLVDRDLDRRVARTAARPLASGALRRRHALAFAVALSLVGLAVLMQFNGFAVALGIASLVPVALYPFAKRVTDHPQAVLGLAFAWGGLMGWAAALGRLDPPALLLYAAAVAWTVGYDTIYALQDLEDDAVVGVRSTARRYGARAPAFVGACYGAAALLAGLAAVSAGGGALSGLGVGAFAAHLLWQVEGLRPAEGEAAVAPARALALFRANRTAGLLLFAGLAADALARAGLLAWPAGWGTA